ncbi:peptidoglycan editing factor PgeF [Devosia sp.]|uniref:peptidoglycan editing factor PgeF n=1 Tax=Devosia sp. TaxID=1871048 RepID=UPI003A8DA92F
MSIEFATSRPLDRLDGIRHGFFGRRGGSSTGDYASLNISELSDDKPIHVANNREQIAGVLGFSLDNLAAIHQVHSADVLHITGPLGAHRPQADGMVSNTPGIALAISTADCTPVLLADAEARVIGACHAGWKGAIDGIATATVDAMVALGARPERIIAAIGPTISGANYEVGPEFARNLLKLHPDAANRLWIPEGSDREHFDLPGFVFDQLMAADVGLVDDLDICTYAAPKAYFSHRFATHRGTLTGRQFSVIGLA